ncbi:MAG: four helix bundle protein [Chitinophagaceae bacterium]|nr:four helix bundle protein [Chitinophagaceae bacterium]
MFLRLPHTALEVFKASEELVTECYKTTRKFPNDEKFTLVQQIRRAAISVHLNIAEGCSRKSENERARFFEISRGSIVEIDTAINISFKLGYITEQELEVVGLSIIKTFKLLSGMIRHERICN